MQTSREEFHKFVDQIPPHQLTADALARLKALLDASDRSLQSEDTLTAQQAGKTSVQVARLAADLQTLLVQIREFELTTPEIRERLASLQRIMAERAAIEANREFILAFQNAPVDDEEETDEELAAVADAREDIRAGQTRPWAEVRQELEAKADNT